MRGSILLLLVCAAAFGKETLVWMCLERCGEDIPKDLAQIQANAGALTAVSFEMYDLGYNSTLVFNNFTNVAPQIRAAGLDTYPMITTVDHQMLYQLFANPTPFINAAVKEAQSRNFTGYNIDFEPSGAMFPNTTAEFAKFLDKFAHALHEAGFYLQVDVATWNEYFWDLNFIAATDVDRVITMETYAYNSNFTAWKGLVDYMTSQVDPVKTGFGLITQDPLSDADLTERLQYIQQTNGAPLIAVWETPLPQAYFGALKQWRAMQ